ncbi:MAG: GTPase Era [Oceanicaulis sp.]|uniref:GTPase Era n=1 Tax=Glycocaulis sp. TaxID=1969725 RepID=UPI0025BFE1AD|nr:GTPase Era [Glycocaulis sp.]MCC5980124.1 GTPase Era [Oceanicaulis sp.]MCH8521122.1 GTPase Era [Glycocaulis sp.]
MSSNNPKRAGFVAVLGAPNAGKSSLVNALVGHKVSIVTQKVQTTRFQIRGVLMAGQTQVVLVDTPGVFAPRRRLDRAMVAAAWAGAEDADVIVHVVDAAAASHVLAGKGGGQDRRAEEDTRRVIDGLKNAERKAVLVLNKIDLIRREELFALAENFNKTEAYSDIFMISASNGSGVKDLSAHLVARMPEGEWFYDSDQVADLPMRLLAAEITREKLFLRVHDELPYGLTVETDSWQERKDGSARIDQTIFVEREGHKPMIIGKGGQTLKTIGELARKELIAELEREVHLFLHVKVRPGWSEERARYSALGLEFDA